MSERRLVRLVVYVLLEREGKILLGKRKNAFGAGYYTMPAGHIDHGESVMECAKRELFEETGIKADFDFTCARLLKSYKIDNLDAEEYVAFCVTAKNWSGEPENKEPHKNEGWKWFSKTELPNPLFPPIEMLMECIENDKEFLD